MQRTQAIFGSTLFLILVLGLVVIYFPYIFCHWRLAPPFFGFLPVRAIGLLIFGAGLYILLDAYVRFALQGLGTPAPVAPPSRLVVTGVYRYVRNPMYMAILAAVWGQGLFFGNAQVIHYGLYLWAGFFAFVLCYEEPALRRKFGAEYLKFCAEVPRWIPRLNPYSPPHMHSF